MNFLFNENEFLKYVEIWNKIEALFNKKNNKKGFHSKPVYSNERIKTKISSYNENFCDFKKLTKNKYCGHLILLLDSVSEVENTYYPQTFLHQFFECSSIKCNNNENSLLKELVQIVDWSDDEF